MMKFLITNIVVCWTAANAQHLRRRLFNWDDAVSAVGSAGESAAGHVGSAGESVGGHIVSGANDAVSAVGSAGESAAGHVVSAATGVWNGVLNFGSKMTNCVTNKCLKSAVNDAIQCVESDFKERSCDIELKSQNCDWLKISKTLEYGKSKNDVSFTGSVDINGGVDVTFNPAKAEAKLKLTGTITTKTVVGVTKTGKKTVNFGGEDGEILGQSKVLLAKTTMIGSIPLRIEFRAEPRSWGQLEMNAGATASVTATSTSDIHVEVIINLKKGEIEKQKLWASEPTMPNPTLQYDASLAMSLDYKVGPRFSVSVNTLPVSFDAATAIQSTFDSIAGAAGASVSAQVAAGPMIRFSKIGLPRPSDMAYEACMIPIEVMEDTVGGSIDDVCCVAAAILPNVNDASKCGDVVDATANEAKAICKRTREEMRKVEKHIPVPRLPLDGTWHRIGEWAKAYFSVSTATAGTCKDRPSGWYDSDGPKYNCAWYAVDDRCSRYGSKYARAGYTANTACCSCGGGTCEDQRFSDGPWYDADGPQYDCAWYAVGDRCSKHGSQYARRGYTANTACCVCG